MWDEFAADDFDDLMRMIRSLDGRFCPPQMHPLRHLLLWESCGRACSVSAPSSVVEYTVPEGDIVSR